MIEVVLTTSDASTPKCSYIVIVNVNECFILYRLQVDMEFQNFQIGTTGPLSHESQRRKYYH